MEYQYLNFFNELLFPTLTNWIVQFTAHANIIWLISTMKILFLTDSGVINNNNNNNNNNKVFI